MQTLKRMINIVDSMRTRIRCPLCGHVVWEKTLKNAPYNIDIFAFDCKKSKGKGYGRNTFRYYRIIDKAFTQRVIEFLLDRIEVVEQYLKLQIGGDIWRKSKSVLMQDAPNTSFLMITPSSYNQKKNVKQNTSMLKISKSRFLK